MNPAFIIFCVILNPDFSREKNLSTERILRRFAPQDDKEKKRRRGDKINTLHYFECDAPYDIT